MAEEIDNLWLAKHSLFCLLSKDRYPKKAWAVFAESFAPLIYSVPAFLGTTLARADSYSRPFLDDIWAEELGVGNSPSHPVLFESFHRAATSSWGCFPDIQRYGITAGSAMADLCGSGPWPIGVAAMLAHEGQFPVAYGGILENAKRDLGEAAGFFVVHSTADIQHSSVAQLLLQYSVEKGIATEAAIKSAYNSSTDVLRRLTAHAWEALEWDHKSMS